MTDNGPRLLEMAAGDALFLVILLVVAAAGVALVLWSRRRSASAGPRVRAADAAASRDTDEETPEPEAEPEPEPEPRPAPRRGPKQAPLPAPAPESRQTSRSAAAAAPQPRPAERFAAASAPRPVRAPHPQSAPAATPSRPQQRAAAEPSRKPGLLERAAAAEAPPAAPEKPAAPVSPTDLLAAGKTLEEGLEKTRSQGFVSRLAGLFKKELDQQIEAQLEEVMLTSDIGVKTAQKLLQGIKEELSRSQLKDPAVVWKYLRKEVLGIVSVPLKPPAATAPGQPRVIAVIGVNGTGKTTSIGKLAARFTRAGQKVLLVAADTFRAAAGEQLEIWANRVGAQCHRGPEGQDPASVAFDGIQKGVAAGVDVVIVDTAGRLHTRKNLVEELKKILRVCGKALPGAPHETLLVLDATIGQNAVSQADIFRGEVGVDGIILSKLDGTAKGGVVIGICDALSIPVAYVGVGEKVEDLRPFSPSEFVQGLFGA